MTPVYHKIIIDEAESPDRQETLAQVEMDAWVRFACASISAGCNSHIACATADVMLQGFLDRFVVMEE